MEGITSLIAAVAWPAVVAWLIGVKYKPEVSRFLGRVKGGQFGDHRIELAAETQQIPRAISDDTPETPSTVTVDNPAALDPQERHIRERLQADFGNDDDAKLGFLIRWLLTTNTEKQHEIRYRLIFGSQIDALELLNTGIAANLHQLQPYYERAREALGNFGFNLTFDAWLNFMIGTELVQIDNGAATITPQGRDFLVYLSKNGIPRGKPN